MTLVSTAQSLHEESTRGQLRKLCFSSFQMLYSKVTTVSLEPVCPAPCRPVINTLQFLAGREEAGV